MMYNSNFWNWGNNMMYPGTFFAGWLGAFLIPFAIWSLAWKGWALWRAARQDSKGWFIALLLINTLGILDILYIFVFGKKKGKSK